MKDIYELLNEVEIDENEFKEVNVSKLERQRGKKRLMASIQKKEGENI